jgi:hypothetical protein
MPGKGGVTLTPSYEIQWEDYESSRGYLQDGEHKSETLARFLSLNYIATDLSDR